jgi:hypothetical protein
MEQLSDLMLVVFAAAVDDRNPVRFGPATLATSEAPGHPHQVCIVQFLIGAVV